MNAPYAKAPDELIEALADLEHQQWLHWSQTVAPDVTPATQNKWRRSWVPYNQLTEELKEIDRAWARKVLDLIREHKLITQK